MGAPLVALLVLIELGSTALLVLFVLSALSLGNSFFGNVLPGVPAARAAKSEKPADNPSDDAAFEGDGASTSVFNGSEEDFSSEERGYDVGRYT